MKIEIENIIANWDDNIPHLFIRLANVITLADDEQGLRNAIDTLAEQTELNKYFHYGFGRNHFWLHQRKLSNGEPSPYRLLKVVFKM